MRRPAGLLLLLFPLALAIATGCSDSTDPGSITHDSAVVNLDPGAGTFTLKDLAVPGPDGAPVPIRLEGANLVTDSDYGTVSIDVAVHNLGGAPVDSSSALVWLRDFVPQNVWPINADVMVAPPWTDPPDTTGPPSWRAYAYRYAELLGDDAVLSPGETSEPRTWTFSDPDFAAFGFAASMAQIFPSAGARIAGLCFVDRNGDGVPQPDEPPFSAGAVQVHDPHGDLVATVQPGEDGRWEVPVDEPGLYEVGFDTMWDGPMPPPFTTPNPRRVLITVDADGVLQSFLHCDFGLDIPFAEPVPLIQFTDASPDSLHGEPWHLLGFEQQGWLLRLHVGFSGCQPDHVFSLWMCGGIAETMPPQAEVVLVHETAEDCDAVWEGEPGFGLGPLFEMLGDPNGDPSTPMAIVLNLHQPDGTVTPIPINVPVIGPPIDPDGD